jgi:hypothetical protein
MNWKMAWEVLLAWFAVVMVIFCLAGEWSVVVFGVTYGLGFGAIAFKYRKKVRPFFQKVRLNTYVGFLLLTGVITVTEEVYCYLLGNEIAHPVLWVDLILVTVMWWVWFSTWYFFLSKRYYFEEKEALLVAGSTGVFYEFVGTGAVLENPFGIALAVPLAVVIYAALFVLPMQLISFTGTRTGKTKYIVGAILPFFLTIPVALIMYIILSVLGVL